jgi:hypothetical protein
MRGVSITPAEPAALGCEPLETSETAPSGSGSQSGSVPLSVFELLAITGFDYLPDSDKWGFGSADKSVVKRQTKWSSIRTDDRACQTFAASPAEPGIQARICSISFPVAGEGRNSIPDY